MKKLREFFSGIDSAGLSFIELIITVAIMGVVGTTIAGAMYVSSRSYTRGAAEVNVQEEAQTALNLISDWVMDATEVVSPDSKTLQITHPNEGTTNVITVYQSGNELKYKVDSDPTEYTLCDYLDESTGVTFNSTFATDRNVNISIDFNINGRTYHAATDTTSRNHDFTLNNTGTDVLNLVVPDSTIVLEPGQEGSAAYSFSALIYGVPSGVTPSLNISDQSGDISASYTTPTAIGSSVFSSTITCSAGATASAAGSFRINLSYTDVNGTHTDSEVITTLVRRVNQCKYTTSDKDYLDPVAGEAGKSGSMYMNTVDLGIQNGAPRTNSAFDQGAFAYIDPSKVEFYVRYDDGSVVPNSVYEISVTDHGTPSVVVNLRTTINKDIYVYVSSKHSGPNSVTGSDAENKATRLTPSNFSYVSGGGSYLSYFKIKKGDSPLDVGAGFQRGANKFLIGELTNDTYTELYNDHLLATDGSIKYVVSLRYKSEADADYLQTEANPYILSITQTDPRSDRNNVFGVTGHFTSLFDCDKAYTVEVTYSLFSNSDSLNYGGVIYTKGMKIKEFKSTGTVSATKQFAYNESTGHFESDYGTFSRPVDFTGLSGDVYMSVYHDTINVKGYYIVTTDGVDKYNTATGNWDDYSTPSIGIVEGINYNAHAPHGSGTYHYQEYQGNTLVDKYEPNCGMIILDSNGTLTTKYVKGYDENKFPDPAVTYSSVQLTNYPSGLYRINLLVDGYNRQGRYSITSLGSFPTPSNPSGSIGTMSSNGTTHEENLGYVYFKF